MEPPFPVIKKGNLYFFHKPTGLDLMAVVDGKRVFADDFKDDAGDLPEFILEEPGDAEFAGLMWRNKK